MITDDVAPLPVGSTLDGGRYRIGEVLRRSGPVITYTADDEQLHRRVAIDELAPEGAIRRSRRLLTAPRDRDRAEQLRQRFTDRARALARVGGGGIARVYGVLTENGTDYAVIQHVAGPTVEDLRRGHPTPFSRPLLTEIAARTAAALRAAHAVEVVHGGLDAGHLVITESGRLVVTGFVLAAPEGDHDENVPVRDVRALSAVLRQLGRDAGDLGEPDGSEPVRLDDLLDRLGIARISTEPHRSLLELIAMDADRTARPAMTPAPDEPTETFGDPPEEIGAADQDATIVAPAPPAAADLAPTWIDSPSPASPSPASPSPASPSPDPTRRADTDRTRVDPSTAWADAPAALGGVARGARTTDERSAVSGDSGSGPPDDAMGIDVFPERGIRRRLTVPLAVAAITTASAAPILAAAILIAVLLPIVATAGDAADRIERFGSDRSIGLKRRLGPWFVKNLVVSTIRALPGIGLGAVLLLGHTAVRDLDPPRIVADGLLRIAGIATAVTVLAGITRPSERFRSRRGLRVLQDVIEPSGRIGERLVVTWVLALAIVAAALWLEPTRFPW